MVVNKNLYFTTYKDGTANSKHIEVKNIHATNNSMIIMPQWILKILQFVPQFMKRSIFYIST